MSVVGVRLQRHVDQQPALPLPWQRRVHSMSLVHPPPVMYWGGGDMETAWYNLSPVNISEEVTGYRGAKRGRTRFVFFNCTWMQQQLLSCTLLLLFCPDTVFFHMQGDRECVEACFYCHQASSDPPATPRYATVVLCKPVSGLIAPGSTPPYCPDYPWTLLH